MSSTGKRLFLSPPWVGPEERRAVAAAFDSGYVAPCGPQVDAFERELAQLAGRRYAVAVSSGTAAIDLLMATESIGADSVVIAPTLTFIATVGPAWHRGARLVFVDCGEDGTIDCALLERALADATAAGRARKRSRVLVMGVDLYGRCCDYGRIAALCRRYGATFVCDSAEAVGARREGRPAGSAGRAAVYSFNGNKIVTTSGGGAVVTDDARLAARVRKLSQQAREQRVWYEHREVGYDYRLSNLLAAVGSAQLAKLPGILARRRAVFDFYRAKCDRSLAVWGPFPGENHWLTVAFATSGRERDRLMAALAEAGIESRPVWKPMHLQPVFRGCRVYGGRMAERFFRLGLCLPSGSRMTRADLRRVVEILNENMV